MGGLSCPTFLEGCEHALVFAFLCTGFEVSTSVCGSFAFCDTEFDFDAVFFPVESEGNDGFSGFFDFPGEAVYFVVVEEEASGSSWVVLFVAGFFVGLDIGVKQVELAILDAGVGALELDFACSDGFDFCAFEFDACFEGFEYVVISAGFAIDSDICRHFFPETRWG